MVITLKRFLAFACVLCLFALSWTTSFGEATANPEITYDRLLEMWNSPDEWLRQSDDGEATDNWLLIDFLNGVESTYGVFFRWNYADKPVLAQVCQTILQEHPDLEQSYSEIDDIASTGFTLPQPCDMTENEAIQQAIQAVQSTNLLSDQWLDECSICTSFIIGEDDVHRWRVIFWAIEDSTITPEYAGYVEINADTSEVLKNRRNDPTNFFTSIPYKERM